MRRLVYWLVPAVGFRVPLEELIHDLAAARGGPVFAPHVTLGSAGGEDAAAVDRLERQVRRANTITLRITGVGTGQRFTHCLFLEFAPNPALEKLMALFPSSTGLEPHLSLLYVPPDKVRDDAGERIRLPFTKLEFDEVWRIPMSGAVTDAGDVAGWRADRCFSLQRN